jgi:hypothetical protein
VNELAKPDWKCSKLKDIFQKRRTRHVSGATKPGGFFIKPHPISGRNIASYYLQM